MMDGHKLLPAVKHRSFRNDSHSFHVLALSGRLVLSFLGHPYCIFEGQRSLAISSSSHSLLVAVLGLKS